MHQHPDYTTYIKAVVLSANDVIATVLLLYEDQGYSPLNIASVSLPADAQDYRAKSKDGKSRFQRGDLITINRRVIDCKKFFSEKDIEELSEMKLSMEDEEEAEIAEKIFEEQANFAKEWKELCKRALVKRNEGCVKP